MIYHLTYLVKEIGNKKMSFEDLNTANYINLETFRKDGTSVKTPVWLAADKNKLGKLRHSKTERVSIEISID